MLNQITIERMVDYDELEEMLFFVLLVLVCMAPKLTRRRLSGTSEKLIERGGLATLLLRSHRVLLGVALVVLFTLTPPPERRVYLRDLIGNGFLCRCFDAEISAQATPRF